MVFENWIVSTKFDCFVPKIFWRRDGDILRRKQCGGNLCREGVLHKTYMVKLLCNMCRLDEHLGNREGHFVRHG
jgi:hypothetical protein